MRRPGPEPPGNDEGAEHAAPLPHLAVGERIGRIRVEAFLGEGGMGAVYLGFDELLERRVALKMLHPRRQLDEPTRARFLREAQVLSRLDHPHVCRVYDLLDGPRGTLLVLEHIEGRTLRELMTDDALPFPERLRLAAEIAEALAAAHREKVVHRDLKPENVMVTTGGSAKVLDFGIARSLDAPTAAAVPSPPPVDTEATWAPPRPPAGRAASGDSRAATGPAGRLASDAALTGQGAVLGTARYMSPEQAGGEPVDAASDVYSLGVVLQELLTGRRAYEATQPLQLLAAVRAAQTVPVTGVDDETALLLRRMLARERAARPSAAEAAARLRWILAAPERRRRRRRAWFAALSVALLAAGSAALSWHLSRPPGLVAAGEQVRVAFLPLANATGEAGMEWTERGLAEMARDTLAEAAHVQVLPLPVVLEAMERLRLPVGEEPEAAAVEALTRALGANLVLAGRLERAEAGYRLHYALHRRLGPPLEDAVAGNGPTEAAAALARRLALRLDPQARDVGLEDRFSADPFANQSYGIGLQRSADGPAAASRYFEVCLDRDPGFLWAKLRLADAHHAAARREEAARLAAETLAEAERRGDRRLIAATLRHQAVTLSDAGDLAGSDALLERALGELRELEAAYDVADVLNNRASNAYFRGDHAVAERLWQEVRSSAQELGYHVRVAGATSNLGAIAYDRRDLARTDLLWREARAAAGLAGHTLLAARVDTNLALLAKDQRRLGDAESLERAALAAYRAAGYTRGLPVVLFNLGETVELQGRYGEAEALYREAYALAAGGDDPRIRARLASALGLVADRRGDREAADRLLAEAEAAATESEAKDVALELAKVRARYRIRRGDLAGAEADLATVEPPGVDSMADAARARLLFARGRAAEALALAERARALPDAWSAEWEAELAAYRAAVRGERLPLPDESPAQPGGFQPPTSAASASASAGPHVPGS